MDDDLINSIDRAQQQLMAAMACAKQGRTADAARNLFRGEQWANIARLRAEFVAKGR